MTCVLQQRTLLQVPRVRFQNLLKVLVLLHRVVDVRVRLEGLAWLFGVHRLRVVDRIHTQLLVVVVLRVRVLAVVMVLLVELLGVLFKEVVLKRTV